MIYFLLIEPQFEGIDQIHYLMKGKLKIINTGF